MVRKGPTKHCTICGNLKIETSEIISYNENTGKSELARDCLNPKCFAGCTNTGGHHRGFLKTDCNRCGYYNPFV